MTLDYLLHRVILSSGHEAHVKHNSDHARHARVQRVDNVLNISTNHQQIVFFHEIKIVIGEIR